MLVGSDHLTDKNWEAVDKVKGDLFMIAGATLYGFSERGFLLHPKTLSADTGAISECC